MGVVNEDTIWIPNGNEYRPYLVHNIYYCEAQNQYTLLYIVDSNGKVNPVLSTKGLGVWEKQLEFHKFCRVHRNVLVNIRHIRKFINVDNPLQIVNKCFPGIVGPENIDRNICLLHRHDAIRY